MVPWPSSFDDVLEFRRTRRWEHALLFSRIRQVQGIN